MFNKKCSILPSIFLLLHLYGTFFVQICSTFDDMPRLDPSISTQSPHASQSSDSCVGQCAFAFIDQMSSQLGSEKSAGLLNLNYNDFLAAFANASFFESFCKLYHEFNFCYTKCPHGYMKEMLGRSAEIVDHFCVYNYKAIMEHFGCLAGLDKAESKKCLRTCTGRHNAVTSLMQNFKQLALNGDSTESERYLAESCEYVTCTMHCDVPAIYHLCGLETAELVVNLTRKSFDSMQRMALDSGAISKWPEVCADIKNYALPKAPQQKHRTAWELTSNGGQNGTRLEAKMDLEENAHKANGAIGRRGFGLIDGWPAAISILFPFIAAIFYPFSSIRC